MSWFETRLGAAVLLPLGQRRDVSEERPSNETPSQFERDAIHVSSPSTAFLPVAYDSTSVGNVDISPRELRLDFEKNEVHWVDNSGRERNPISLGKKNTKILDLIKRSGEDGILFGEICEKGNMAKTTVSRALFRIREKIKLIDSHVLLIIFCGEFGDDAQVRKYVLRCRDIMGSPIIKGYSMTKNSIVGVDGSGNEIELGLKKALLNVIAKLNEAPQKSLSPEHLLGYIGSPALDNNKKLGDMKRSLNKRFHESGFSLEIVYNNGVYTLL